MASWQVLLILFAFPSAIISQSGITAGTGDIDLSARFDAGENCDTNPNPHCFGNVTGCPLKPSLQPQVCQNITAASVSVQYTTFTSTHDAKTWGDLGCRGADYGTETQNMGDCVERSGGSELRQYKPLIGACNSLMTEVFATQYVRYETDGSCGSGYSDLKFRPTDVCLAKEGDFDEGEVFSCLPNGQIALVTYPDTTCTPGSYTDVSIYEDGACNSLGYSGYLKLYCVPDVYCMRFDTVNIDWNFDNDPTNDYRNLTYELIDPAIVLSSPGDNSASISSGDSAFFSLYLASQPSSAVSVVCTSSTTAAASVDGPFVFTSTDFLGPQTVTVTGIATGSSFITCAPSSTVGRYTTSIVSESFLVDVTDPGIIVQSTTNALTTGETTTLSIELASIPSTSVDLFLSSSNTASVSVLPSSLIFDISNYNVSQDVTVSGDSSGSGVVVTVTPTTNAGAYTASITGSYTVSVANPSLILSGYTSTLTTGDNTTASIALASKPSGVIEVNVSSSAVVASAYDPSVFTFSASNYNIAQSVTVTGVSAGSATISAAVTSGTGSYTTSISNSFSLAIADPGITVNPDVYQGYTGSIYNWTIVLNSNPNTDLTISCTPDNTAMVSVENGLFNFDSSNWNIPQADTTTLVLDGETVTTCQVDSGNAQYTASIQATLTSDAAAVPTTSNASLQQPHAVTKCVFLLSTAITLYFTTVYN